MTNSKLRMSSLLKKKLKKEVTKTDSLIQPPCPNTVLVWISGSVLNSENNGSHIKCGGKSVKKGLSSHGFF